MRNLWVFIFLSIIFLNDSLAQKKSKADLEKEKKENLKKISEAEQILKQTESKKKNSLGQLQAINQKIKVQNQLINSIKEETKLLDQRIKERNIVINSLNNDLVRLKEEYGKMIYNTNRFRNASSKLSFLFSANSFTQLIMRMEYLKQYSKSRRIQVEQIELVKETLSQEKKMVESELIEKNILLSEELKESKSLATTQKKQSSVISNLKGRERELRKEVASRKKAVDRLDKIIADLVRAELAKAKSASSKLASSDITASFERSKKNLNWPVQLGFISASFGKQNHPYLKGIQVENNGIEIQTQSNQEVNAVFNGEVINVRTVPGKNSIVIIKHGEYYTVYANLKSVIVKRGDVVVANQKLGEVYTTKEGVSELEFQVWKNSTKLNPENWLAKR